MEWISVKDELPEHKKLILVCSVDRYYRPQFARYNPGIKYSDHDTGFRDDDMESLHVTHWMPIPEPPEK